MNKKLITKIEAYAYEAVYPDYDGELFYTQYLAKERAREVEGDIRNLYTAEQMQEYAKECVREAIILNSGGAVSDDMIKRAIDSVFTEDTKND